MNELGLLDYLLIAFSLAFSWRMYHSAQPPPAEVDNPAFQPLAASGNAAQAAPGLPKSSLDETLRRIATACHYASIDTFITGAKSVYETVIAAFAAGDIEACSYLLAEPVRDSFAQAIAERLARGETAELVFIGFKEARIADAGLDQERAWIAIRFVAELVSVTRNSDGRVIAGSPGLVATTSEVWTFERELKAPGPDWLLVMTDADA
ncbi:Tim44/TimA family putative adaptor protein [Devosia sp. A449]